MKELECRCETCYYNNGSGKCEKKIINIDRRSVCESYEEK